MENFVVSARKYRPATFDTVVGQAHITITLKNAIKTGQLAQAFLFCGPRGVGKTTCARILAKTINCQNLTPEGEACNTCDSCKSFNNQASFNVHELDAASNNSVDDIRSLVEQVRFAPQAGKYKIYIIDEVHMLSNAAFNAFLKTLEEPPSYAIFILATTEKHKIIPTILSRCQIFDFNRIQIGDIANHLSEIAANEHITAETEALNLIARKADGGLRDALSMFDMLVTFSKDRSLSYKNAIDNLHILDYDYYFRTTDALLEENAGQAWLIFDEILKKGFDGHHFLVGLCEHFLLVCRDIQTIQLLEVSDQIRRKYAEQSRNAGAAFWVSLLNLGGQADLNYKQSKSQRLLIEMTLLKMAHIKSAIQLANLNGHISEEKKNDKPQLNEEKKEVAQAVSVLAESKTPTYNTKSQPVKTTFSLPNLEELERQVMEKPVAQTVTENGKAVEVLEDLGKNDFTEADLLQTQALFVANLEAENRTSEVIIARRNIAREDTKLRILLDSETQLHQFNQELKHTMAEFFRKNLRNGYLIFQGSVAEVVEVKKSVYTVEEKFRFLLETYPHLQTLKKDLNLELL
jgi:DNA polymerase III subunit gamma/tau